MRSLGVAGDTRTETEAVLIEHDVPYEPFSPAVLRDLPTLPWVISESDYASRMDLREYNVCSIDPPGAHERDS